MREFQWQLKYLWSIPMSRCQSTVRVFDISIRHISRYIDILNTPSPQCGLHIYYTTIHSSLSDMISIYLQLLAHVSVAIMLSSIDNGKSKSILGPEELVTDFAILTDNTLGKLPDDFTICSSVDSRAPFQLLYENGKPWISVHFKSVQKDSRYHRMIFFVSTSTRPNIRLSLTKTIDFPHTLPCFVNSTPRIPLSGPSKKCWLQIFDKFET